jgi:hypothetical protein
MRRPLRRSIRLAAALAALLPAAASAQSGPLASLIPNLFDQTIVLANTGHQAHFLDSSDALREAGLQINSSVVSQLSTFPISSSGGGFTFSFDPELGVFTRSTASFGPLFAERAQTVGRGKWNFGINHSRFSYDSIDGFDLDEGDLELTFIHLDTNDDGTTVETVFEGDYIHADALLELEHQATVISINYGLTDKMDVAIAVPMVTVDMNGTLNTTIERLSTAAIDPPPHVFSNGTTQESFGAGGSATGVGDILARVKYNFFNAEGRGLAAAADLRLPTGDEDNLLGSGATQVKLLGIAAMDYGRFYPHLNLGYTFSFGGSDLVGDLSDEISFTVGFDAAVHERVTLAFDVLWRTLLDATQVERREVTHLYKPFNTTQVLQTQRPVLETERQDLNLTKGSFGIKVNLAGQLLLNANLLVSWSDDGLTEEDLVPLIGLEYGF